MGKENVHRLLNLHLLLKLFCMQYEFAFAIISVMQI